jgi:Reverse transcriptase (RNA-dependent DNA polymerase)
VSLLQFAEIAVHEAIMDLDEQKGPGPDGITSSILKKLVTVVQVPLTFLFNLSLSSGVFSAIWKESFIVSIFKTGEKRNISCYRRISILSTIPKLFEKMVCNELTPMLSARISHTQHGFMKGRSTVTNLMEFTNFWTGHTQRVMMEDFLSEFLHCHFRELQGFKSILSNVFKHNF